MFDEKTILARLQNGEDAQKIADEMAAVLNQANKAYADQKAVEEATKKRNEVQKKEDLQEILDLFTEWFKTYYGIDAKGELEADAVLELIDSIKDYVEALKDLEAIFGIKKPAVKATKSNTKPKNADEQIRDFLNKMGW